MDDEVMIIEEMLADDILEALLFQAGALGRGKGGSDFTCYCLLTLSDGLFFH